MVCMAAAEPNTDTYLDYWFSMDGDGTKNDVWPPFEDIFDQANLPERLHSFTKQARKVSYLSQRKGRSASSFNGLLR